MGNTGYTTAADAKWKDIMPGSSLLVASDAVKEGLQHPYALRSSADILLDGDPGRGEGEEDEEYRLDRGGGQQGLPSALSVCYCWERSDAHADAKQDYINHAGNADGNEDEEDGWMWW